MPREIEDKEVRVDLLEEASAMMKARRREKRPCFLLQWRDAEDLENKCGCKLECMWEHLLGKAGAQVVTAEGGWRRGGVEIPWPVSYSHRSPLGCPLASLGQRTECSSFPR